MSAEYRGTITDLLLLAKILQIQARMPLAFLAIWAHCWLMSSQYALVPFCLATVQPLCPQYVALHGVVVAKVQGQDLGLIEPHVTGLYPSIQSVHIPQKNLPTLQQTNTLTQLDIVREFSNVRPNPLLQIINNDIK
ncbi:hypothetical protein DUI87_06021 [Hirundo rustica rustica]|uniref:Uncharacterized protein n=1 Tax=Hirundo rustica rustica TaxID=333673 RepID=A0A3M0KVW1_HIRRU|nr:hypothetical protein DUI87_06021 [Hirundo rustica rustica]